VANQPGSERNEEKPPSNPYAMMNIGMEMAAPVLLLLFAGYKADSWLDTDPWFKVVGAMLGMVVGFYNFYKRLIVIARKKP
jgi:F0F1-type ATP synthase assembly protein I